MRIGIDIGGMSIKLGLVDEQNRIIAKRIMRTDSNKRAPEEIVKAMAAEVCEMMDENNLLYSECKCIGIACPGIVDSEKGIVRYSNNLNWEKFALVDIMKQDIPIPLLIANDADAAALGEVKCGAAKGKKNAVLLTLGTGVGSGVVLNGKIFSGGMVGGCELGHMAIQQEGKLCICGRRGCLEQYASATALMAEARKAAERKRDSLLWELCDYHLSELNGRHIFEAARLGDITALNTIKKYEEYLSAGIVNVINIFRPEIIVLGGGISAQGNKLTMELQSIVDNLCFGGEHGDIPPIVTSILGNDAGIFGAANLGEEENWNEWI